MTFTSARNKWDIVADIEIHADEYCIFVIVFLYQIRIMYAVRQDKRVSWSKCLIRIQYWCSVHRIYPMKYAYDIVMFWFYCDNIMASS